MVIVAGCVMLALLTLTVGAGLVTDLIGGVAAAFNNSISQLTSQAPPTAPPSGVTLDTPVLDPPANGGYTNTTALVIQGSVPGASVGKSGYTVHVYVMADGVQRQVASVPIGATTRFSTPSITLIEGSNVFQARISTPTGEGQPSPVVTYILDTTAPKISIGSPAQGTKVTSSTINVTGITDAGATITVRNEQAPGGGLNNQTVGEDGKFSIPIPVVAGSDTIDLTSTDQAGNSSSTQLNVNRDYGQLAAHVAASPSKFASSAQTTLKLTLRATSFNGGPLADAKVTFTVTIQGLGPIVSPELTTDATGTAVWQVDVSGAAAGTGEASALVVSPAGDQVSATTPLTTT